MAVPADWDFNLTNWLLYATAYVSAPTSLKYNPPVYTYIHAISKKTEFQDLKTGRIVSNFRSDRIISFYPTFIFRHQTAPGAVTPDTGYMVRIDRNYAKLYRRLNAVETKLGEGAISPILVDNTWYQFRVTWWTSYDYQNNPSLACRVERWYYGAWVTITTLYDTQNLGLDTNTNRPGVGAYNNTALADHYVLHDDTELWIPT